MAEVIFEKAKQVSSPLNISLNGGTIEGTNKFTYNGSASKTINITPSSIGAATSGHSHSAATTSANGFMTSNDKKIINSIGLVSSLGTTSKEVVGAINEVNNRVSSVNSNLDGRITSLQSTVNNLNTQMGTKVTTGTTPQLQNIELYFRTPFIDFHFDNSTTDHTSRIIENSAGTLSVNGSLFSANEVVLPSNTILQSGELKFRHGGVGEWSIGGGCGTGDPNTFGFYRNGTHMYLNSTGVYAGAFHEQGVALSSKYATKGGYKILSVQNIVVRCGLLAANGGSGDGITAFTPVSGAIQYIPCLVATGWVAVSGVEIRGTSLYCTFINTSTSNHTGAGVFVIIAIGAM